MVQKRTLDYLSKCVRTSFKLVRASFTINESREVPSSSDALPIQRRCSDRRFENVSYKLALCLSNDATIYWKKGAWLRMSLDPHRFCKFEQVYEMRLARLLFKKWQEIAMKYRNARGSFLLPAIRPMSFLK